MSGTEGTLRTAPGTPGDRIVPRPRLIKHLLASSPARLVLLKAPAGFSKTTCLAAWDAQDARPFLWLQATRRYDDPMLFAADLAAVRAGAGEEQHVLVIDDLHLVESEATHDVLRSTLEGLPHGSQLAIASRHDPPLPLGRLRANRELIEIGQRELALSGPETSALLENIGLRLRPAQVEAILDKTEGWPAATYLAGLSLADQPEAAEAVSAFAGDDRFIVDYLREEFLASTSPGDLAFLTRSSILEELTGPACDAVLERSGSAALLRDLARANSLVIPLDRADNTFRYHHLFGEMLTAELQRREPDLERDLHARASRWYAGKDPIWAVDHAISAGEVERAGELIWRAYPNLSGRGQTETIRLWFERLGDEAVMATPRLALTRAHLHLTLGEGNLGAHWGRLAGAASPEGTEPSLEPDLRLIDATLARHTLSAMGSDAAVASEGYPAESPWQTPCYLYRGAAAHLAGHPERALPMLREAVRRGAVASPVIESIALVQLCLIAWDDDRRDEAERLIHQAREQVRRCGLEDYGSMVGVFAASAFVLASAGRTDGARDDADRAAALLGKVVDYPAWYEAETRILLGRAYARLGQKGEAEKLLASAGAFVSQIGDAAVLSSWLASATSALRHADAAPDAAGGPLTRAEVRTLQYLPSHLSFREIGEEIHVSPNTIKTQARALYRKLGATSRAEAVQKARQAGLLDDQGGQSPDRFIPTG